MIGNRIQALRLEQNISLSELARKARVAKSYLSAIERHIQFNPSIQIVARVAEVLNVPVETLLQSSPMNESHS